MKEKLYDTKCWDLANDFFDDEPGLRTEARVNELAWLIQQTIEDYFLELEQKRDERGSNAF